MASWEQYDPSWLADIVRTYAPDEAWLPEAVGRCTRAMVEGPAYMHFVDPCNANEPGSEWQFSRDIVVEHPEGGTIVFGILVGNRVGGVEFVDKIEA